MPMRWPYSTPNAREVEAKKLEIQRARQLPTNLIVNNNTCNQQQHDTSGLYGEFYGPRTSLRPHVDENIYGQVR